MDSNKSVLIKLLVAGAIWGAMIISSESAWGSSVEMEAGDGLKRTSQGFYCNKPDLCDRQFLLGTYRSAATIPSLVFSFSGALLRERIATGIISESWSTHYDSVYAPRSSFRFGFDSDRLRSEMGFVAGFSNAGHGPPLGESNSAFALRLPNGFLAPSLETILRGHSWRFTVGLNPSPMTEKDGMVAALLGLGGDQNSLTVGPVLVDVVDETLGAKVAGRARIAGELQVGAGATAVVTGAGAGSWIGSLMVGWQVP